MKKLLIISLFFLLSIGTANAKDIISPIVKIIPTNTESTYDDASTGFFLNKEGYILTTSDNVIQEPSGAPYLDYYLCPTRDPEDIPKCTLTADVVMYFSSINLALLKLNEEAPLEFEEFKFADYSPEIDEEITIEGFGYERYEFTNKMHPLGGESLISMKDAKLSEEAGTIIQKEGMTEGSDWYWLTDAVMNLGNSGSPVYNSEGGIIGISSGYGNGDDNNYYLIPPSTGNGAGYIISADAILYMFLGLEGAEIIDEDFTKSLFTDEHIARIKEEDEKVEEDIFYDVDIIFPYAQAIRYLKENGIISGYPDGTFKPYGSLNRAELLKILVETSGETPDAATYNNCFPDVKDDWYAKYVCFASSKGWVNGYPDGTFKPANPVNKAEAVKMLMEVFNLYKHRDETFGGFDGYPYLDVKVGSWFMQYIGEAKEIGLLEEKAGSFYPDNFIDRGQISEIIFRLLIVLASNQL